MSVGDAYLGFKIGGRSDWFYSEHGFSHSVSNRLALMRIIAGDFNSPQVRALLEHHVATARAETAAGSAHALDLESMKASDINFWAAWDGDVLIGVGALKRLSNDHGEIKSMHTVQASRRKGVGTAMLLHIVEAARANGVVSLKP